MLTSPPPMDGRCPKPYDDWRVFGSYCYSVHNYFDDWYEAISACRNKDIRANMVSVHSEVENHWVFEYALKNGNIKDLIWLGMFRSSNGTTKLSTHKYLVSNA